MSPLGVCFEHVYLTSISEVEAVYRFQHRSATKVCKQARAAGPCRNEPATRPLVVAGSILMRADSEAPDMALCALARRQ